MANINEHSDSPEVVTHVVPRFFPQIDGVGDYARLLGTGLWQRHGTESRYLIGDPDWRSEATIATGMGTAVAARSSAELANLLGESNRVILHFSGYGYHSRGVPWWLLSGIRRWRRHGRRTFVVVFHELWASGPPWRSEFYLGPFQRRIAADLLRLCDAAVTSTRAMVRTLDAIQSGKTRLQAIANSLPEVDIGTRQWHDGGPVRVVVFGQEGTRLASVAAHARLLGGLEQAALLESIFVVGKGAQGVPTASADVQRLKEIVAPERLVVLGDVSPTEGARLLAKTDLFLSSYPSHLMGKSSSLTAALACGCVPVLREGRRADNLEEGREFLSCDGSHDGVARFLERIRTSALAPLGRAAREWQATHASWPTTADLIASLL